MDQHCHEHHTPGCLIEVQDYDRQSYVLEQVNRNIDEVVVYLVLATEEEERIVPNAPYHSKQYASTKESKAWKEAPGRESSPAELFCNRAAIRE